MSFFYGDIKTDELKTANGLELQGGSNNAYTITLDTRSNIATNYQLNLPSVLGTADQYLKILDVDGSTANLGFATVSGGTALDDITAGDALSNLTTTAGTITIYPQADDLIMKTVTGKKIKGTVNSIDILELYDNGANITGKIIATDDIRTITDLEANTGLNIGPTYNEFKLTGSSTHQSIASTTTGNIDFKLNTSNIVMRLQGSSNSVLIPTNHNLYFRDTNSNINSSTSGTLNLRGSTTVNVNTATLNLNVTDVANDGNFTNNGTFKLGTDGNEFEISETSDNITIKNTISDADIIFNLNDGGTTRDMLKLDASDNVVIATNMNTSNTFSITQGSNTISTTTTKVLDFSERSDFLITVSGNSTVTLACTNVNRQGQQGSIIITQTAGTNALSWQTSNGWYFPSATAPTLSSGSGIYDVFSYLVVGTGGSKKVLIMDATNFQAY